MAASNNKAPNAVANRSFLTHELCVLMIALSLAQVAEEPEAYLMDGLDGLCGGVTAIIAAGFLFLVVHMAMNLGPNQVQGSALRIVLALAPWNATGRMDSAWNAHHALGGQAGKVLHCPCNEPAAGHAIGGELLATQHGEESARREVTGVA